MARAVDGGLAGRRVLDVGCNRGGFLRLLYDSCSIGEGFGYDPAHSIVRASQEGLAAVLFKPFRVEQLMGEVRKAGMCTTTAPGTVGSAPSRTRGRRNWKSSLGRVCEG